MFRVLLEPIPGAPFSQVRTSSIYPIPLPPDHSFLKCGKKCTKFTVVPSFKHPVLCFTFAVVTVPTILLQNFPSSKLNSISVSLWQPHPAAGGSISRGCSSAPVRGITQSVSFGDGLTSLGILSSRFIDGIARVGISFFKAESMDHILFTRWCL